MKSKCHDVCDREIRTKVEKITLQTRVRAIHVLMREKFPFIFKKTTKTLR